jgi:hypothetical protein
VPAFRSSVGVGVPERRLDAPADQRVATVEASDAAADVVSLDQKSGPPSVAL